MHLLQTLCSTKNNKVDMPNSIIYLNYTPIFGWYVVSFSSNKNFQKDTCLKEIGLRAQETITILGSLIIVIGVGGGG